MALSRRAVPAGSCSGGLPLAAVRRRGAGSAAPRRPARPYGPDDVYTYSTYARNDSRKKEEKKRREKNCVCANFSPMDPFLLQNMTVALMFTAALVPPPQQIAGPTRHCCRGTDFCVDRGHRRPRQPAGRRGRVYKLRGLPCWQPGQRGRFFTQSGTPHPSRPCGMPQAAFSCPRWVVIGSR